MVVVVVLPWVPAHGDIGFQAHQFGKHFGAADHGQALAAGLVELCIARFDRRRDHHDLGLGEVFRRLAYEDLARRGVPAAR